MLCRTAHVYNRVACRSLRCQRQERFIRSYSTSLPHKVVARDMSHETTTMERKQRDPSPVTHPSTRTAYIRLWEPTHTMADVWSVKRAMEKKYGAILETYFLKDFEVPDKYQMMAFVIFRDLAALERIPEKGEDFTVLAPELPSKPIYDIGLKEIEPYAGMDDIQPGFEFDKVDPHTRRRVIGGCIRRSPIEFSSSQEDRNTFQLTHRKTMSHFLNWGGFTTIDALEPEEEGDLFKPDSRQNNARMRAALQLCSRITSIPIPQGVVPTEKTPEDQTVPTPGPSLESARIFAGLYDTLPSAALGRVRKEILDGEAGYEKTIAAAPALDVQEIIPETKEPEPAASLPKSPTIPPRPKKRLPISPETKQKLESQLLAARQLQLAARPVRRKQLKPAVIEPVRNPKLESRHLSLDQADIPVVEEKQEKSFLAKLAGLFMR